MNRSHIAQYNAVHIAHVIDGMWLSGLTFFVIVPDPVVLTQHLRIVFRFAQKHMFEC